jgi:hypothetical protein
MAFVYVTSDNVNTWPVRMRTWSGSAFNTAVSTVENVYFPTIFAGDPAFSAVAIGDNVQVVFAMQATGKILSALYHYATNSFDASLTISNGVNGVRAVPQLTYDVATTSFYAFWYQNNIIQYSSRANAAGAWSASIAWITGETLTYPYELATSYLAANTASYLGGNDVVPVLWQTGAVAPFNIRYYSLSIPTGSSVQTPTGTTVLPLIQQILNVTATSTTQALTPQVIAASLLTSLILAVGYVKGPRRRRNSEF